MSNKNQHIVPHDHEWAIKGEGNSRYTSFHETQAEAILEARNIARNQSSEMLIHGKNGQIREKNTYGHDPHPPKG